MPRAESEGLPVLGQSDCADCGACCQGNGSPVLLYNSALLHDDRHPFRPDDLPADLIKEIDDHFLGLHRGEEDQAACLWYDAASGRCRHYRWRPRVCRDFELGSSSCLAERRTKGVDEVPGL